MTAAPVLETARLTLRPFRASDADAQAAMMGDPIVTRHLGGQPFSREEGWRKLLCGAGLWTLFGYGYWAVERRDDGRFIGQVGFADFRRDMTPRIEGLPEMGWLFAADTFGQGYASEAVAAGLDWIDRALAPAQIVAIIDEANGASIRVAEKAGFAGREPATYRSEPILIFRR
ncbi:GNAT family N-acetyltransferase [Sphingosinicella sp.]|uniref:GNAT family N-acetyltransferase n=1 Tax=Sphingosinicella sp. TaxID=1917971 RepID=UPI0040382B47